MHSSFDALQQRVTKQLEEAWRDPGWPLSAYVYACV